MTEEYKQAIIINTSLKMQKGKACAQSSHASLSAYLKTEKKISEKWIEEGMKKIVLKAEEKEILSIFNSLKKIFPCALIKDAGRTQIPAGSITALGIGPAEESLLNKHLSHLKLF